MIGSQLSHFLTTHVGPTNQQSGTFPVDYF